jgi:hypothetical protein
MRRKTFGRVIGLVVVLASWMVMERSVAAHCLGGSGIYSCCQQAANCDASTAHGHYGSMRYYRKWGSNVGRPEIHRTGQLSQRNRNGGIN